MQRLKVKEVLKPSASNGAFCILFVAVDKKYAAGGKQETTGGESGPSEARSLQKKSTRRNEKENLQGGNGFRDQPAGWSRNDGFSI